MNKLIKKLLRQYLLKEEMKSVIDSWQNHIIFDKTNKYLTVITTIARDDKNDDRLYLFVGFRFFPNATEYSYSFMVTDVNNVPKTDYLTTRAEVAPFIPNEIKNKQQIFPIIKELTRKLLNKMLPDKIHRKTVEPLTGGSLSRYDEITKIMVNEFGYKLLPNQGENSWILVKDKNLKENEDMLDKYDISVDSYVANMKEMFTESFNNLVKNGKLK